MEGEGKDGCVCVFTIQDTSSMVMAQVRSIMHRYRYIIYRISSLYRSLGVGGGGGGGGGIQTCFLSFLTLGVHAQRGLR